jgi:hypothetical protein
MSCKENQEFYQAYSIDVRGDEIDTDDSDKYQNYGPRQVPTSMAHCDFTQVTCSIY